MLYLLFALNCSNLKNPHKNASSNFPYFELKISLKVLILIIYIYIYIFLYCINNNLYIYINICVCICVICICMYICMHIRMYDVSPKYIRQQSEQLSRSIFPAGSQQVFHILLKEVMFRHAQTSHDDAILQLGPWGN